MEEKVEIIRLMHSKGMSKRNRGEIKHHKSSISAHIKA